MKPIRFALGQVGLFFCGSLIYQVFVHNYEAVSVLGCIITVLFMINTILTMVIDEKEKERLW